MKHFLSILILTACICTLCACNSKTKNNYIGSPYTKNHGTELLCETDSAYFIAKPSKNESENSTVLYLYYCDKATLSGFNPYCNRAECSHSDSDCNAYLGQCKAIAAYDDQILYVINEVDKNTIKLMRMSLGGTAHEKICEIAEADGVYSYSGINFYFHYNYLIYSLNLSNLDNIEDSFYVLYSLDLNNIKNGSSELLKVSKADPEYSKLKIGGETFLGGTKNTIYMASYSLFECGMDTGKYISHSFPSDAEINTYCAYINGKIMYFKANTDNKYDLYAYDPINEKEEKLNADTSPFPTTGILTDKYVYIVYSKLTYTDADGNPIVSLGNDMKCGLYVYNHNGEIIKFIKEEYPMRQSYLMENKLLCFENKGEYVFSDDIELRFPLYSFDITNLDGKWSVIGESNRTD